MRPNNAHLFLFCCCCLFILALGASPAIAGPADTLNGSWTVDVEATVAAKAAASGRTFSKKEVEDARKEKGAQLQLTFDLEKKQSIFRLGEREQKRAISKVTVEGNTVTLHGDEKMAVVVESQNRIRMDHLVFQRKK